MSIPEILDEAAKVIEERGWYQGGFMPADPQLDMTTCPVCVLAAINVAADSDPDTDFGPAGDRQDAAFALADFLGLGNKVRGYEEEGIEMVLGNDWNDQTAESAREVVDVLRECAASLKAGA